MSDKPNQLGWVTSINVNQSMGELITADLSIVASDPGALMNQFREWMRGGVYAPTYHKEWRCLYCTSPNSINKTHCTQCGAPRSFILG